MCTEEELPEHHRGDAVSSMVYEANARIRDPVYGCVGAISSLQQQIDVLQAQLALSQAEVVHMRMRQYSTSPVNHSPENHSPPSPPDSNHFWLHLAEVDEATLSRSAAL
ncbi:lateral organ boundaries domain-containing protein [Artemisia annua]|uniref:Lateral organ boundaries domain-containing protein n=1 Tax=Artemisia annua TaxID=35608 RepID=A0A2U1M129_ARTAN|nr:lateral organ boundaries domain-containing protein [Artemisia annua]